MDAKPFPRPSLARSRRPRASPGRLFLLALLLVTLLGALQAVLWRWMGSQLEDGFAAWAAARRAQGWMVEHGPPVRGGWPFSATLTLPDFHLRGAAAAIEGGVDWRAGTLVLRVALPRLDTLRVELPQPQRLRLGTLEIPFAAERLEAELPLEAGVLPREADLVAERLRIGTEAGLAELRELRVRIETRATATDGEAALSIVATLQHAVLPMATPLGQTIDSASLDAVLTGPVPPGRESLARAETWRDNGGTLDLRALTLRMGQVNAAATATLAFDEALQPMGAGTVRLAGAAVALDALAAAGVVGRRAAAQAKAVLALLQRAPAEGGPPQVEVPLTLEDRTLAIARIAVARLPRLDWTAPPTHEAPR